MPGSCNSLRRFAAASVLAVALIWSTQGVGAQTGAPDLPPDVPPDLPSLDAFPPTRRSAPTAEPSLPPGATGTGATGAGERSGGREPAQSAGSVRSLVPFQLQTGTILSLNGHRDPQVPTGEQGPDWTQRFDLRMVGHHSVSERVGLLANLRLRTQAKDGEDYRFGSASHIDLQELAVDVKATDWLTVEAGRINVRNGVATGFNPTDWFKADSLIVADSFDTADRREDRLGTAVLQGVWHNEDAVLVTGYRVPMAGSTGTWLSDRSVFGQGFNRTNGRSALYAKLTPLGSQNLSTTVNAFYEPGQPGVGAEVSGAVSETLVLFAEWFAQHRRSLVDESHRLVPLPLSVADRLGAKGRRRLLHQVSVGANWSLPAEIVGNKDVSLTAEYHYNQSGLSKGAMDAWFDAGLSGAARPGPLWAVRGTASRLQEPLSQHELFFRFAYKDVVTDVDLGAIAFVSPQDGSALVQADVDVKVLVDGRLKFTAFTATGRDRSVYGSLPSDYGCRVSLSYTF
ncbi:hypothetical protein [Azospirillum griseum]|uniref:Alginate export domain-containing protein n=1 Tax=Azospirillum griseum TaxID=2496639 RepID=A0A431VJA0_9PROT|nr:hypothetical protein [Azospirillum griseum]RTR21090.1 hypothetical protein EJ903_10170 [Azospirillum griseum]